ncbi:substrate-binding domain-containing protein [Paracoccus sp. WLY502]|uniref:ABC transporter substrate-binding protein n=1 Tax=Paracoccus yibinensis TaxID=3068891 RepID=UPI00279685E6|nr:substrate-binding domain-containing protein [Paracoccus sp. WLY502]MDQ1902219.1 substrate-binding domain-containing protein [Paracoccus sp. WLY502]
MLQARLIRDRIFRLCAILGGVILLAGPASAEELRIITSYQEEVVEPMLEAFGRQHPEIRIRVLNKNTNAAVSEMLAGNERRFDLFWASAPEAFVVLDEEQRLLDLGKGPYADFAWSALGWSWRVSRDRPVPQDWDDLLDPAFAGEIAMSHPMRSGTMHSLLETILQQRGWQEGWAWILELAGQLNTISARSFGVLEGVEEGEFGIGLTIDFLALTQDTLEFRYGTPITLIPARIAALQGGMQPEAASLFITFVLSEEGQRLLLRPDVHRIPAHTGVRDEAARLLDPAWAALDFTQAPYDPKLAAKRYWQVNQLFEAFVARDLLLRRDLWRRLHRLAGSQPTEADKVRRLLTWMPLTEDQVRAAASDQTTVLEWAARSYSMLNEADALIRALEQP